MLLGFTLVGCTQPASKPKSNHNFYGKITAIKDGDTYKILTDTGEATIRLAHIDCPEKRQPFGTRAKQFASDLCFAKQVKIIWDGSKDRNGRLIAEVYIGNFCVNKELVKAGLAWHFKKYSNDESYDALEQKARKLKVGLWSEPNAIAPWEWRKKK